MGNETSIKPNAKAVNIAITPPLSVSLMLSKGAWTPAGKPVDEAAALEAAAIALEAAAVVGEAMTNRYCEKRS